MDLDFEIREEGGEFVGLQQEFIAGWPPAQTALSGCEGFVEQDSADGEPRLDPARQWTMQVAEDQDGSEALGRDFWEIWKRKRFEVGLERRDFAWAFDARTGELIESVSVAIHRDHPQPKFGRGDRVPSPATGQIQDGSDCRCIR